MNAAAFGFTAFKPEQFPLTIDQQGYVVTHLLGAARTKARFLRDRRAVDEAALKEWRRIIFRLTREHERLGRARARLST